MNAHDVLAIVDVLEGANVTIWLDGGWGVDALVGRQTRPHHDVDVVISLEQVRLAETILRSIGYAVVEDELPARFVMGDSQERSIDMHPVTFDLQGDGIQQLQDGTDFHYPRDGFAGRGCIENHVVRCITAEAQVFCHLGYEPDEKDLHDMRLLQTLFRHKKLAKIRSGHTR